MHAQRARDGVRSRDGSRGRPRGGRGPSSESGQRRNHQQQQPSTSNIGRGPHVFRQSSRNSDTPNHPSTSFESSSASSSRGATIPHQQEETARAPVRRAAQFNSRHPVNRRSNDVRLDSAYSGHVYNKAMNVDFVPDNLTSANAEYGETIQDSSNIYLKSFINNQDDDDDETAFALVGDEGLFVKMRSLLNGHCSPEPESLCVASDVVDDLNRDDCQALENDEAFPYPSGATGTGFGSQARDEGYRFADEVKAMATSTPNSDGKPNSIESSRPQYDEYAKNQTSLFPRPSGRRIEEHEFDDRASASSTGSILSSKPAMGAVTSTEFEETDQTRKYVTVAQSSKVMQKTSTPQMSPSEDALRVPDGRPVDLKAASSRKSESKEPIMDPPGDLKILAPGPPPGFPPPPVFSISSVNKADDSKKPDDQSTMEVQTKKYLNGPPPGFSSPANKTNSEATTGIIERNGETVSVLPEQHDQRAVGSGKGRISTITKPPLLTSDRLPICDHRAAIESAVRSHRVVIVVADTGTGKSTQLSQFLHRFLPPSGRILCTQPRKVAAISLAKRVQQESGGKPAVSFEVCINQRAPKGTRITYVTEAVLLRLLRDHPNMEDCVAVIVDEAHERTVNTDVCLGLLKQCLRRNSTLKVVVTSATIDPAPFINYFAEFNPKPIIIEGRQYPVDVVYRPPTGTNKDLRRLYLDRTVTAVYDICVIEAQKPRQQDAQKGFGGEWAGHVLAFLPAPNDTEMAERRLQQHLIDVNHSKSVQILQLHGRQQDDDQQAVFDPCPSAFHHKVIFATNSAQTSVTVPGIRYVVDCGLGKLRTYDPRRCTSVLEIVKISRGAAIQRAGRAGRSGPGVCWRLYSEEEFEKFEDEFRPEIVRTNLAQTLLYLISVGFEYPIRESFQFMDAPDEDAFFDAYRMLKSIGALDNAGLLTELGRKMMLVPLEPRLAQMLLSTAENYRVFLPEMVVIVACIAVGNLFVRFGNDDQKNLADVQKLSFSDDQGDAMTMLRVYNDYRHISMKKRGPWCGDKFINGRCMKTACETMSELSKVMRILGYSMANPRSAIFNVDGMRAIFSRLYFEAYGKNLARCMGKFRDGYYALALKGFIQIHPSSTLAMLDICPLYIVYEFCLNTQENFAINVCAVDEAIVLKKLDRSVFELLEQQRIISKPMNVGTTAKRTLIRLREQLQAIGSGCRLEKTKNDKFFRMAVHYPTRLEDKVQQFLSASLDPVQKSLVEEMRGDIPVMGADYRVLMGAGFEVKNVTLHGEYTAVTFGRAGEVYKLDHVQQILAKYGALNRIELCGDFMKERSKAAYLAFFHHPANAAEAVECLGSYNVKPWGLTRTVAGAEPTITRNEMRFSIRARWWRRPSRRFGFIKFETTSDRDRAYEILLSQPLPAQCGQCSIKPPFDRPSGDNSEQPFDDVSLEIHLERVDPELSSEQLESAVRCVLEPMNIPFKQVFVVRHKSYPPDSAMVLRGYERDILQHLVPLVRSEMQVLRNEGVQVGNDWNVWHGDPPFAVRILPPKSPSEIEFRATVDFQSPQLAERVAERLDQLGHSFALRIDNQWIRIAGQYETSILINARIWQVVRNNLIQLKMALEYQQPLQSVKIRMSPISNGMKCSIWICGRPKQLVMSIRDRMQEAIDGTILQCRPPKEQRGKNHNPDDISWQYHRLMTGHGERFIGALQQRFQSVLIITVSLFRCQVQLQGANEIRDKVVEEIHKYLRNRAQTIVEHDFILRPPTYPTGMLRELLARHHFRAEALGKALNNSYVWVECNRHLVHFEGIQKACDDLQSMLADISSHLANVGPDEGPKDENALPECAICLGPIDGNPFCLDGCGHYTCVDCILNQIAVAVRSRDYPIVCAAEDCGVPIVWTDMERLVLGGKDRDRNNDMELLKPILDSAVGYFLMRNGQTFRCCVTPDCRGLYRIGKGTFACRICDRIQCMQCGCEQHEDISCEEYQSMRSNADKSLQHWLAADPRNRRLCPTAGCRAAIEKNQGCMHMQCLKCRTHFCWFCMHIADNSADVYAHMTQVHGDVGGMEMDEIIVFEDEIMEQLMQDDFGQLDDIGMLMGQNANARHIWALQQAEELNEMQMRLVDQMLDVRVVLDRDDDEDEPW